MQDGSEVFLEPEATDGFGLRNSKAAVLEKGLVWLDWRREFENEDKITFLSLVFLTLFD